MVEPKYSYSNCSMQPGWNVKYHKSGLVVIRRKEMCEAELLVPFLSEYVQKVFWETKAGQGAKWLMLDVKDAETVEDIIKLIGLRVKPKTFPK